MSTTLKWIELDGIISPMPDLEEDILDIDFNNSLMIQIEKYEDGYRIINAVDGYGKNQRDYYAGKKVRVLVEEYANQFLQPERNDAYKKWFKLNLLAIIGGGIEVAKKKQTGFDFTQVAEWIDRVFAEELPEKKDEPPVTDKTVMP